MTRLAICLCTLLLWPSLVLGQSAQIEALLESQLSGDGRTVEIDGFAGALSAQARMDRLRISDADGVWLELEDVVLDWTRSALLRGVLDVDALTAGRLRVERAPLPAPGPPSPQASGFRIPDLPIAIQIDRFAIDTVELGAALIGDPVSARIAASATLDADAATIRLDATRTDAQAGRIDLNLDFDRAAEILAVLARVEEPAGGILATVLNLPDRPALALDISGDGPLDRFAADLSLATNGADRLAGRATLAAQGDGRRFDITLSGDLRPLLQPDARAFFGQRTELAANGVAARDGTLDIRSLTLQTAQLQARGQARFDPERQPERLDLDLIVDGAGGVRVPGTTVELASADMSLSFDAATGPDWFLRGTVDDLRAAGLRVAQIALEGSGQIMPGSEQPFTGSVALSAEGVDAPTDPGLAAIIAPRLRLETRVTASASSAVALRDLTLDTPHALMRGTVDFAPTDGRARIVASVEAEAPDLAPFSGLAGLPLQGTLAASIAAEAEVPGGAISVSVNGRSQALDIGQLRLAPFLAPETELELVARRDETGTRIDRLTLENAELSARVTGQADEDDGALDLSATLRDTSRIDPRLDGPVDLTATLSDLMDTRAIAADVSTGFGLRATVAGRLGGAAPALDFDADLDDVTRFVPVLDGAVSLNGSLDLAGPAPVVTAALMAEPGIGLDVTGPLGGPDAALEFDARVDDLGAFAPPLPGPATARGRLGIGAPSLPIDASLTATPGIAADIAGRLAGAASALTVAATIDDLGALVPPLPGPARITADLGDLTGDLQVDVQVAAARGLSLAAQGRPLGDDSQLDVQVTADDLRVLVPQLPGPARADARISDLAGAQRVNGTLNATALQVSFDGQVAAPDSRLDLDARLARLDLFAPGLTGGANVVAGLTDLRGDPGVSATLRTDTGASATVDGRVGLGGRASDLRATGALPLGLASSFVGNRALTGDARFDLSLAGPLAPSSVSGQVVVANGRFFDPDLDLTLSDLGGTVALQGARADIGLRGDVNGGDLDLSGGIALTPPYSSDLDLVTTDLLYALDGVLRTRVGARIGLRGPALRQLAIGGRVDLFDTEIRVPDTGLGGATPIPDIRHVGAPAAVTRTRERAGLIDDGRGGSGQGTGPTFPLDIQITARDPIFVRGRGLDAAFDGNLRIGGTARVPVPVGQFALQRGRLDFLGRRLTLTEGLITAAGSTMPRLRVVAESILDDITARIIVEGPADAPDITVSSAPELPQDEVLARLLFGRSFDTLSPFQIARLVASVRTLAGRGSGLLEGTRQAFRFDNLDIRTDEETGATELAIGQRLTEDVYSEVEVDSNGDVQLNLNLDIGRNTRLRGSVTNTGDTGLGVFWERDY